MAYIGTNQKVTLHPIPTGTQLIFAEANSHLQIWLSISLRLASYLNLLCPISLKNTVTSETFDAAQISTTISAKKTRII